ncbi:VLF-1 [Homarus gammarus nudivirus]|uniref:VLF-1 n=1 Tax=Homarus gammarus nudivirus TaxID=2509616 RepID=A0A411HB76_9VIRU|nr:VLF-1 [Homarus gammarus nudivirus]QBB28648.1 VLF-1 [Homarus gammarus nudivirus]
MDICFINTSDFSKNHVNTVKYIKHSVFNDDVSRFKTISIAEFGDILRQYKTKRGTPLCYGSIKCLFYTMAKERPDWDFDEMKRVKNTFWVKGSISNNLYNSEMSDKIMNMIEHFVVGFFNHQFYDIQKDVAIAVIITVATNLRIAEIKQLKRRHIIDIINGRVINIKMKKKYKGLVVLAHKWLLQSLLDSLPSSNDGDDDRYLVTIATSTINKYIKNYIKVSDKHVKFGIQSIRKVNTTLILEHCNIELAQAFNRHTKTETTQKYYNNKTYIGPTINKIVKAALVD